MAWFSNMTLKGKLLLGFITVAIIAGVIGGYGIYNIRLLDAAQTRSYEKMTVPLGQMADIAIAFQRIRINSRDFTDATTPDKQEHFANLIKELRETIDINQFIN